MKRPRWGFVLATAGGVGASVLLLRATEWTHLRDAWVRLTPFQWGVGFLAYVGFVALKGVRCSVLLGGGFDRRELMGIVAAQTFWSNVLPIRAGDLSYVLLMRQRAGVTTARGVASLLVASFLDLGALLVLGAVLGGVFWRTYSAAFRGVTLMCLAGAALEGALVFGARWAPPTLWERVATALERLSRLGGSLGRLVRELRSQMEHRGFLEGVVWSFGVLGVRFAFQIYLLEGMFGEMSVSQGLLALTFAGLVNLLPIQGVANLGSIEVPWTWALVSVGVPVSEAIASGFALHGVVLVYSMGVGAIAWVLLR